MPRICIVEDNAVIADNTAEFLKMEGYQVDVFYDGEKGFEGIQIAYSEEKPYELAILDRMLPGLDGLSIARLIKSKKIPTAFLFLTAKDKQTDIIEGLELEADDYLIKPFDLDELVLRIKNILRRTQGKSHLANGDSKEAQIDDIWIDFVAHKVTKAEKDLALSPKEYSIFSYLAQNRGQVITREQIFENVWNDYGSSFSEVSDTINVHIAYLRRKLGKEVIRTVKGVGYVIDN